jgi:hypothetical protein
MVVSRLALENELSKCEEELRMLGASANTAEVSLITKLIRIRQLLHELCIAIPAESAVLKASVELLYEIISSATRFIQTQTFASASGWESIKNTVSAAVRKVQCMQKISVVVDKNLAIICRVFATKLTIEELDDDIEPNGRIGFFDNLLKSLGNELSGLDTAAQSPDGEDAHEDFYGFLGISSKNQMLLLIQALKR